MNYHLHITKTAEHDLNEAADYIEFVLKNPTAADHLLALTEDKLSLLSISPEIYPIIDDPVLSSWKIRIAVVNNYLAFYTIDENAKTVFILRFLYCKIDWISILGQEMSYAKLLATAAERTKRYDSASLITSEEMNKRLDISDSDLEGFSEVEFERR